MYQIARETGCNGIARVTLLARVTLFLLKILRGEIGCTHLQLTNHTYNLSTHHIKAPPLVNAMNFELRIHVHYVLSKS